MATKPAREKLMDYLARRDHSEMELRQKLMRNYEADEIQEALDEARESGWIIPAEDMAAKVARQLHGRRKGYFYICNYLRQKGLPKVPKEPEIELQKAREIAESKLGDDAKVWKSEAEKLARWLKSRGFEDETIWKVINEEQANP